MGKTFDTLSALAECDMIGRKLPTPAFSSGGKEEWRHRACVQPSGFLRGHQRDRYLSHGFGVLRETGTVWMWDWGLLRTKQALWLVTAPVWPWYLTWMQGKKEHGLQRRSRQTSLTGRFTHTCPEQTHPQKRLEGSPESLAMLMAKAFPVMKPVWKTGGGGYFSPNAQISTKDPKTERETGKHGPTKPK